MRIRAAVLLIVVAAAVADLDAQRRRAVRSPALPSESEYLRAARQAANWITSQERANGDTLSWPVSDVFPATYTTGIDAGASGIGFFFLRLHAVTQEAVYLDKAEGAANFVMQRAAAGLTSYDWLNGAAGAGSFLLAVHRATGEQRYLDGAKFQADWLVMRANPSNGGVFWGAVNGTRTFTGIAHGAAGVAMFLLDMHEATNDARYFEKAEQAYVWISGHTLPAGDGVVYKRLIQDDVAYPGWCGGTSGILLFLEKLATKTGNPLHREALIRAANGLVNSRIPQDEGSAWLHYGPNTGFGLVYCHGAPSVAVALAEAARVTNDPRHLEIAREAATFIESNAVPENPGLSWFHFKGAPLHDTGFMTGTASVGHTYLRLYRATNDARYLELARGAAAYLLKIGEHPDANPNQLRWINFTHAPREGGDAKAYGTGWYEGAAGIGLFLLELESTIRGNAPSEFSGFNP